MDFSMPYCRKTHSAILWLTLLLGLLSSISAMADGIVVNKAELRKSDESYQLTADFGVNLNFALQQALTRGVPLYFVSEFTLRKSRWYWLDEKVAKSEQVTKLSYSVLTGQYRISRGALFQNFTSLDEAMSLLQRQSSATIPAEQVKKNNGYIEKYIKGEGTYFAAVRMVLDIEQLPKLLQVNALTSQDWNLDSGWYRWVVSTAEVVSNGETAGEETK
jgi:Domain of unknown function (DUF4390)